VNYFDSYWLIWASQAMCLSNSACFLCCRYLLLVAAYVCCRWNIWSFIGLYLMTVHFGPHQLQQAAAILQHHWVDLPDWSTVPSLAPRGVESSPPTPTS
jgi:hypothetical protein